MWRPCLRSIILKSSCFTFFVGKGLIEKDVHKQIFPVYGGKYLSCKAVHSWVEKFADDETEVRNWLRQQSKYFYDVAFDALVKRWDKYINVGGGYVEKETFLPGSNITCFTLYIHL
jgi:hypothetical protein